MPLTPSHETRDFRLEAAYVQTDAGRRESLIRLIRESAGIGEGHYYKKERIKFYSEIKSYFDRHSVAFHPDNNSAGAILKQIFSYVPRGKFSLAIAPLLHWMWDTNPNEMQSFYEDIELYGSGFAEEGIAVASRLRTGASPDYLIDTLSDYFDYSRYSYVQTYLSATMDGTVALSHDVPWKIEIKRFEFFTDDCSLILHTTDGSRRPVGIQLPDHIVERLMRIDSIRVIMWERGPQPDTISHDHYPLKIIS